MKHKAPGNEPTTSNPDARWSAPALAAFRFFFVYLSLFILAGQVSGSMIPNLSFYYRGMGRLWPMRGITEWVAQSFFGVSVVNDPAGGEPLFFWVQAFWILIVSIVVAAVWSLFDRRRSNYIQLNNWFRLFVRFALAGAMFEYGMTKVIPTQFPAPSLDTLVTPTGDLTLSALLWASIGSAPAYEIFTGCVELLGAILLLLPRTAMLGATISFAAMVQVFALNMTFDVGLKMISLHLMVLAAVLLAPDFSRFLDFFVRDRGVAAPVRRELFRSPHANRLALIAQVIFGIYLIGMYAYINVGFWQVGGGGRPKSPLYGIWNVESLSVDGQTREAVLNDYDRRWRRVIFDDPGSVMFQRTDDSFARYGASVDPAQKTLTLTKGGSKTWKANFRFTQPSPGRLALEGQMDGHSIVATLRLVDFDTFRLLNSDFRWVRPHDR